MYLNFQTHTGHANRLTNAVGTVNLIALGQHVQNALVGRDGDSARRFKHALDIGIVDFGIANRNRTVRIARADMGAGNAGKYRMNLTIRHEFGFFDSALDRLLGRFNIDHHATLQPARGMRAQAHDLNRTVGLNFADDSNDFAGADIEPDDQ